MTNDVVFLERANEDDWLDQRKRFVTATDVVRLARSAAEWAKVRDEKNGLGADFPVSREMEWGNLREPALVEYAGEVAGEPVEANDRLAVRDRWAATPDGLGGDFVVECKTGSAKSLARRHSEFVDQCQWQMLVTGLPRALLVAEERATGEEGEFLPGSIRTEWIDRDDARISELVDVAERFLAGDGDWELEFLLSDALFAKADAAKAAERAKAAESALREYIGDRDFRHSSSAGSVSLTTVRRTVFDVDGLRAAYPEVFDEFSTRSLDVKALKAARPEVVAEFESTEPGARRMLLSERKPEVSL